MATVEEQIESLEAKRSSKEKMLEAATAAWKKCRQMRGADAHKRAWHYEGEMNKNKELIEKIDEELAGLRAQLN